MYLYLRHASILLLESVLCQIRENDISLAVLEYVHWSPSIATTEVHFEAPFGEGDEEKDVSKAHRAEKDNEKMRREKLELA